MPAKSASPVEDAELERLIRHYGDCCYHADDAVGLPSNGVVEAEAALRSYVSADTRRLDWLESKGTVSIYFINSGQQFNPASQSLRSAISLAMRERPQ